MQKRFGSSLLDDFVKGHSAADVFREIVQNEYDGEGTSIEILFGPDELHITGSGKPIGGEGWKRLSVIAGTGPVVGDLSGDVVDAKANGIGSKNFGIRSLFYFGDEVNIRSNGRAGSLDFNELGTDQFADASSRGLPGVNIHVPYRQGETRGVEPFTVEREARAMEEISQALLPTLVKLANVGRKGGIEGLTAVSERTGRKLVWRQTARSVECKLKGVAALKRTGRLSEWKEEVSEASVTRFEEIEFSRSVAIPDAHLAAGFPAYYRAGPKSLRLAISLPLKRNRIDFGRAGYFHYPLQAPQGRTGMVASVSAPFEMDNRGSSLLSVSQNAWQMMAMIGEANSDFDLPEVRAYLETQDAEGTKQAKEMIDEINRIIFDDVLTTLKNKFGEVRDAWWLQGVPKTVRNDCDRLFNENEGEHDRWRYMYLVNYSDIVLYGDNWELFKDHYNFYGKGKKADLVRWIGKLAKARTVTHHAEKGPLSRDQVLFVARVHELVKTHIEGREPIDPRERYLAETSPVAEPVG